MGRRGRQRAKETKKAREVKYQSLDPNFDALARELGGAHGSLDHADDAADDDADDGYEDDEDEDGHDPRAGYG